MTDVFDTWGSLWRSCGERNRDILEPRNFACVVILVPVKQTRMSGVVIVGVRKLLDLAENA